MLETTVVIIGGGATGVGLLRDLSLRGVKAMLFEQGGLAHGTSSRFHGLLHSGARYAVKDADAARECIEENTILRRVGQYCVESTEGFFVLTDEDDPAFVDVWAPACAAAGISATEISVEEALRLEPALTPRARRVFRVPDAGIDGFRLLWQNAVSARSHGGSMHTYHTVTAIRTENGRVCGVSAVDKVSGERVDVACNYVVNAAGPWAGEVARLAGLGVDVTPDRGSLIVFNHRFTSRVVNKLRPSADGDIFVPHGTVTIFGTTSATAQNPSDTRPTVEEVLRLLDLGEPVFPRLRDYRILRVFAGNRPLYTPPDAESGRGASRNFVIVDHAMEGLSGMASIFGGKLTTYRLMAERMADVVCAYLGLNAPCRTREDALVPEIDKSLLTRGSVYFPPHGVDLAAERLGIQFGQVVDSLEQGASARELICECEMVTRAEVELVAADPATHFLHDIRYRTRLGMGTCQGTYCSLRAIGVLAGYSRALPESPRENARAFLRERWRGIRPALWGRQLQEIELGRAIFGAALNIDGDDSGCCRDESREKSHETN